MAKTFYQPQQWDEYFRDTPDLDLAEHGAYLCLRGVYWQNGGALPDDLPRLQRILRAPGKKNATLIQFILQKFFRKNAEGSWVSDELDLSLFKLEKYREAQSEKSAKAVAGRKKSDNQRDGKTPPVDQPTGSPTDQPGVNPQVDLRVNPDGGEENKEREYIKEGKPSYSLESFSDLSNFEILEGEKPVDVFLRLYPKPDSEVGCRKAWAGKRLDQQANEVFAGLAAWMQSDEWQKENGKFIPYGLKFLTADRWKNPPKPKPGSGGMAALAASIIITNRGN